MTIRYCKHCGGKGSLCASCGKGRHLDPKARNNSPYDGCWRQLRYRKPKDRTKPCPEHTEPVAVCDMCQAEAPAVKQGRWPNEYHSIPDGWQKVSGLTPGEGVFQGIECCPTCHGTIRVGFDWSLELGGESRSVSIACAFAFQLGQVTGDLARSGAGGAHWWATFVWEHLGPDYLPTAEARIMPCRDQAPSGAQCSLPVGHDGSHRAGSEVWLEVAA